MRLPHDRNLCNRGIGAALPGDPLLLSPFYAGKQPDSAGGTMSWINRALDKWWSQSSLRLDMSLAHYRRARLPSR